MSEILRDVVARNRAGAAAAIPSVCTAHPDVLRASMALAARLGRTIVVEATSNQVNQEGGYTGMTPEGFVRMVRGQAGRAGLDHAQLILGGDHLGPQAWRALPADQAMDRARVMVADYVRAGFSKIHLDCSQGCAGEAPAQSDAVTAARSADLARACLDAAGDAAGRLVFVIGTEVPPPGGAVVDEAGDIPATPPAHMQATLDTHRQAFAKAGIAEAFAQVAGLVVQPGVEFSPMQVHGFPPGRALGYHATLADWPGICLEAHSTDYQAPEVFPRLAREGFAFQKVGPALTFAWRQALYGLDILRRLSGHPGAAVSDVMEEVMLDAPQYWQGHYRGDDADVFIQRHFGLADRIRYYWPDPRARAAVDALMAWATARDLPAPFLAQVFAPEVIARAEADDGPQAQRLIDAQVQLALAPYFFDEKGMAP